MTRAPSAAVLLLALWAGSDAAPALAAPPQPPVIAPEPACKPQAWWNPPFTPVPGVKEFSGRLIARPRQPADLASLDPDAAARQDWEARVLLAPYSPEHVPELDLYIFEVPAGSTEDSLATKLLSTGLYQWVRPDWNVYPASSFEVIPNDPLFSTQWHLARIRAPAAWDISPGSASVIVAVIDTGVNFQHQDLAANMVLGYCSRAGERAPQTVNPPNNTITMDSNGHGTGVAGVLGAVANNEVGIAGVGWNLRVMPIRATSTTGSTASIGDIINGAMWASANGARVISVSFAGVEEPALDTTGRTIRSRNALLVWAMDNRGLNTDTGDPDRVPPIGPTPFDHPHITVVSGSGYNDEHWCSFANPTVCSSYGGGVDLAAPAYSIALTTLNGGYGSGEGVSFATPMVSAALGLIWSVAPSLTPAQVEQALLASVDDIGAPGEDVYFGRGRLNLRRALWNAVIRQNAASLPAAPFNERAFSIDDIYEFILNPMDVTGDGLIDEKELQAVQGFMRRKELKDLVADRP